MRRLLKPLNTRTTSGLEHFKLKLQLPVFRREQFDLSLLSDHDFVEFNQSTLEMSELDLDIVQTGSFGHGGVPTVDLKITP